MSAAESEAAPSDDVAMKTIVEAATLETYIDVVRAIVDEAVLECHSDGILAEAVDAGNVSMVYTTLESDATEHYESSGVRIGINLQRFADVIALADSGDLVTLEFSTEKRKLSIEGPGFGADIASIDPDAIRQSPDRPEFELPCEFGIDASEIQRAIKGADLVSDRLTIVGDAEENTVTVVAKGDTDDIHFEFDGDDFESHDLSEDVESILGLDYFARLARPMSGEVSVDLGEEMPVKFQFDSESGPVTYVQAPRIKEGR